MDSKTWIKFLAEPNHDVVSDSFPKIKTAKYCNNQRYKGKNQHFQIPIRSGLLSSILS